MTPGSAIVGWQLLEATCQATAGALLMPRTVQHSVPSMQSQQQGRRQHIHGASHHVH